LPLGFSGFKSLRLKKLALTIKLEMCQALSYGFAVPFFLPERAQAFSPLETTRIL